MNLSLERKIMLGFVTAVVAVLATGAAAWLNARRIEQTITWVEHTHQVRYEVESILVHTLNMQTSVRGFALTGEPSFLAPFEHASVDFRPAHDRLLKLVADNPVQQARARELAQLSVESLAAFDSVISARRAHGFDITKDAETLTRSKATVDRVRALIAEIDADEQALLRARSGDAKQAVRRVGVIVLATVLITTAALAMMLRFALNDYRRRVRAEQELADFFRLSLDPMSVVSPDGRFVRLNPAWESVLGYPLDQLVGRPFLEFVHPDDIDRTHAEAARIAGGQEAVSFQNRYRARDGTWRWLEWNSSVVPGSGYIMAVSRDVTTRKQDEERIERLNAHLQAQNTELEAFSYSVSHDLRAPLRHMTGFAHLLEKHAAERLDEKGRHYLATITNAAQTMGRLIDNLLEFSRTARAPINPQPVDHGAIVGEIIGSGRLVAAPNVEWKIGTLPVTAGDVALLRQVWTNFLSNAVKYSSKTQPHPIVEVIARRDDAAREVVFSVRDNGVGFDPRYGSRLFQVFTRLHDAQEFEGTGIGLALVRRIVTRHGGRTWAESEPGKGATFYFSLPVHQTKIPDSA